MASVAAFTTTEGLRSPDFGAVPPLAWMAGAAALVDLIFNRVLIPLRADVWSDGTLDRFDDAGSFARNLSVVSALVALSFCLASFSSEKSGLPFAARTGIASFGWVFVSIIAMMTFLPRGLTRVELVLATVGLAHGLILLLVLAGIHWRSTWPIAIALALTLVASFSSLLSTIVSVVGERTYWEHADRLSNAFRWSGELAYLAVPVVVSVAIAVPIRETRGKLAVLFAMLVGGAAGIGMVEWEKAAGGNMADLLYGAVRLDFLTEEHAVLYAVFVALACGAAVTAMLSRNAIHRPMAAALLLLLSAGYAPRSPSTLIVTVLGVALLARVGIARARLRQRG